MNDYRDIVIAGGGMVGISLGLRLAAVLPETVSILLLESYPLPAPDDTGGSTYHPSFDARATALSYSSRLIYESTGVWDLLADWACPIETIHVSSRGRFGSALLTAADHDWPALGYVLENACLGRALVTALHAQGRVQALSPARVLAVSPRDEGVRLSLQVTEGDEPDERQLDAGLVVVADGVDSSLCRALGVASSSKPYGQHALVASVASDQPHGGRAFERFTDEGPLALLPLIPSRTGEHRSSLVWTLPEERLETLLNCPEDAFLDELQRRFGYRLGRLQRVGERHSFPLNLVQADEQARQGIVVMGNAAHALHPVAGQGFNLALRDVAQLGASLAQGLAAGKAVGDLSVLQGYQRQQATDQDRTIRFSDRVPGLFMSNDLLLGTGRDLALAGLDLLPSLKREFVRQAAGVAALGSLRDD